MLDRRRFLLLAGAGLVLGLPEGPALAVDAGPDTAAPGALVQTFLRIGPDNIVTVICKHLEMGQGIWSGLASIVAEELDASWDQIRMEGAPTAPAYIHTKLRQQVTGGSTSIANSFVQMRQAGATARAMLVAAAAARWRVAVTDITVSDGRVRHDASGRSASFGELAEAARAISPPQDPPLKDPATFRYLGKSWSRPDIADKTTGKTIYAIDMMLPDMRVATLLRPGRFGAKVARLDDSAALAVPGVERVVNVGTGVAVIARHSWAAIGGQAALQVEWDESGCESRSSEQILADYIHAANTQQGLDCRSRGQPEAMMARAARTISADFHFPYLAHAGMEPLSLICQRTTDGCTLWGGFQNQTQNQRAVAALFEVPPERVTLHTLQAGSGFGRRATFDSDWVMDAARIVKASGETYPIKLMWTREDDIRGGYYRPLTLHRMQAGLAPDGRIMAMIQTIVGQSIFLGSPYGDPALTRPDRGVVLGSFVEGYDVPDARLRWISTRTGIPVHTFRGVANNHTAFAKEVFIDMLAKAAGQDAIAYRLAYLAHAPRLATVLRLVAEKAGWGQSLPRGHALGVAVHEAEDSFIAQVAEVSMEKDAVTVHRVTCAIDCGFALNPDTVLAQIEGGIGFGLGAAMTGRIDIDAGAARQSNFHDYLPLRMDGAPRRIDVHILRSAMPPTGVGEPGVAPIGAAVANAIARITGTYPLSLPLRNDNG